MVDLDRLSGEVEEKNQKIAELHSQLRESIKTSKRRAPSTDSHVQPNAPNASRDQQLGLFEDDEEDFPDSGLTTNPRESQMRQSDWMNDRGSAVGQSGPMTSTMKPSSVTHPITASTQTYPLTSSRPNGGSGQENTAAELTHVRSKLRDTDRLNSALRAELDIYKSVLGDGGIPSSKARGDGKQDPNDVLKEYLEELRELRKRLEESIRVNDRLRQKLEEKLASMGQESGKAYLGC